MSFYNVSHPDVRLERGRKCGRQRIRGRHELDEEPIVDRHPTPRPPGSKVIKLCPNKLGSFLLWQTFTAYFQLCE
jgi:hypothetical protein